MSPVVSSSSFENIPLFTASLEFGYADLAAELLEMRQAEAEVAPALSFDDLVADFEASVPASIALEVVPSVPIVDAPVAPAQNAIPALADREYGPVALPEREVVRRMAAGHPNTVVLTKYGKSVSVIPADLQAFGNMALLVRRGSGAFTTGELPKSYDNAKAQPPDKGLPSRIKKFTKQLHSDCRVHYSAQDVLRLPIERSPLHRMLTDMGFHVVVAPSLAKWAAKETRRMVKGITPFELPEVVDDRPLLERADEGVQFTCTKTHTINGATFDSGAVYTVISRTEEDPEQGISGSLQLIKMRGSESEGVPLTWPDEESLEEYFQLTIPDTVIYDPAQCKPQLYKAEYDANLRKVEASGAKLYKHTRVDLAQELMQPWVFNGKPMRSGKTREALMWMKLRGAKRVAFLSPNNGIPFVERELEALGIQNYCVVDHLSKVRGKQPWIEIIPHGWMKYQKDPLNRRDHEHIAVNKNCPHCGVLLERVSGRSMGQWIWTTDYGFICRNRECSSRYARPHKGAAWAAGTASNPAEVTFQKQLSRVAGSGYVDLERKVAVKNMTFPRGDNVKLRKDEAFHGRERVYSVRCGRRTLQLPDGRYVAENAPLTTMGQRFVEQAWQPPRVKRIRKRYTGVIGDELHAIQAGPKSDIGQAVLSIRPRTRIGLTGTLMPNEFVNAYWPLYWIYGGTYMFPYGIQNGQLYSGLSEFTRTFAEYITIQVGDRTTRKRLPSLKDPTRFWQLMSPLMIRRCGSDPLFVESMQEAGFKVPHVKQIPVIVEPVQEQVAFMLETANEFERLYERYLEELERAGQESGRARVVNSAYVLTLMTRLRIAATCPDYFNDLLRARGITVPIYKGPKGGAKMGQIYETVLSKVANGGKVVVLSGFRSMQRILAEELRQFNPVVFQTSWKLDRRREAFEEFENNPSRKVFIAGTKAVSVAVDLGVADTVISTDLDWRPGEQTQAWARILKPQPYERNCEILSFTLDCSIDKHIWNTFYSKLNAAEQALDRKILTKKQKHFDVKRFVDQVLADRGAMRDFLDRAFGEEPVELPDLSILYQPMEERTL